MLTRGVVTAAMFLALMSAKSFAGEESYLAVEFSAIAVGAIEDPTGLWSPEEIKEGGSQVQSSIHYFDVGVEGGRVVGATLWDAWCGAWECPFRFYVETDAGDVYQSDRDGDYHMVCSALDMFELDAEELVLWACGQLIDLKTAK